MTHALISHSSLDDVFFSVTAINSIIDKNNHLFEPYIFIYDAQDIPEEVGSLLDFYSIKYISIEKLREFATHSLQKKVQTFFSDPYKISSILPLYLQGQGYRYSLNIDKSIFCFSLYSDQKLPSDGSLVSSRFKNVDIGDVKFNNAPSLIDFYHDGKYKVIDNSFYYLDNEIFKASDTIHKYIDYYEKLEKQQLAEDMLHIFAFSSALISTRDLTEIDKSYYHSANNCTFVDPQLKPNIKNIVYTSDNYPWDNLNRGAIKRKVEDRSGIVFFYRSTWLNFAAKNPWFSSFCSQKVLTGDNQVGMANIVCYWYNQKIIELENKNKDLTSKVKNNLQTNSNATSISLDALGVEQRLKQSSLKDDYLSLYEQEISNRLGCKFDLLIITNENIDNVATVYSKKYPDARITLASYGDVKRSLISKPNVEHIEFLDLSELINYFNTKVFNIIIEHCSNLKSHKLKLIKNLFFRLSDGGLYFIQELHAKFIPALIDCNGPDILDLVNEVSQLKISDAERKKKADSDAIAIAECCESVFIKGKLGCLIKNRLFLRGIRNGQAKDLIISGKLHGELITYDDNSYEFSHEISSVISQQEIPWRNPKRFIIPESFLAKYYNVHCEVGQIVHKDEYLLPDSFRMQHHKKLANRNLISLDNAMFSLKHKKLDSHHLAGEYFYLDSEYPCHFGHFTSEVVSRLWAWEAAKKTSPNIKVLIGLENGQSLPSFVETILSSYGIEKEKIQIFRGKITVDVLYSATPYYVIGNYINPLIKATWDKIGAHTDDGVSGIVGKKLFIARPEGGERQCLNAEKLERILLNNGFEFYQPEKHSWKDQVKTFTQADIIAGYAGSGTFNAMFAKGVKKLIIIGSDSYTAANEHYICAIKGFDITYFLGNSIIKHDNGFSGKAFMSDYNFDYDRDEKALIDTLKNL